MRIIALLAVTTCFATPLFAGAGVFHAHKVKAEDTCISADKQFIATYQVIQKWLRDTPLTDAERQEDIFELTLKNKTTGQKLTLQEVDGKPDIDLAYRFTNDNHNLSIKTKDLQGRLLSIPLTCSKRGKTKGPMIESLGQELTLNIPAGFFETVHNNLPAFVNGGYFGMSFEAKKFMRIGESAPVCVIYRSVPHFVKASPEEKSITLVPESNYFELSFVGESETEWFRVACHEAELYEESIRNSFGFPTGNKEILFYRAETPTYYSAEKVRQMLLQALPEGMIEFR